MGPMADDSSQAATSALPVTGAQYAIAAGEYQATITELGAGLRKLTLGGQPVVKGYGDDELPPAGAGQLLVPWPNRIDRGQYAFGGRTFQLDLTEPAKGNAIHGLTRWATWQVSVQAADRVELSLRLLGRPWLPVLPGTARRLPSQRGGRPGGHRDRAERGQQRGSVRHGLAPVPASRHGTDRRLDAPAARSQLAARR